MSEPATSTTIVIDDLGDLTLLAGSEPHTERKFFVSRKVMRMASPVWNAMLDPTRNFVEGSSNEIPLPDDDPDALCILLNIAHLHFLKVPLVLGCPKFLALAVLSDKYDVAHLVAPFVPRWLPPLCNSNYMSKTLVAKGEPEEKLFMAWTFGIKDTFEAAMRSIILHIKPGMLMSVGHTDQNRQIPERYIPQGLLNYILEARDKAISSLISILHDTMYHIGAGSACRAGTETLDCKSAMYGSIALTVVPLGLWPTWPDPSSWPTSVQELAGKLQAIHICTPQSYSHKSCYPTIDLKAKVKEVLANISVMEKPHVSHMEQRAFMKNSGESAQVKPWWAISLAGTI